MATNRTLLATVVALACVGFSTAESATSDAAVDSRRAQPKAPLEGTWVVTIRPIVCSGPGAGSDVPGITPVVSHLSFVRGGVLIESTSNPNFGAGKRGSGQGVWERTGRTSYQFAFEAFLIEPNAPYLTGLQRIDQTVELHTDDEWTSSGPVRFFETFDLGTAPGLAPYRAGCARATGVRFY
jgi:hypothetical protein